jgi:CO/xanthine dehydrogenase FAD-binding subunit
MIESVEVPRSAADVVTALSASGSGTGSRAVLAGGTLLMAAVNNTSTGISTLVSTRRIGNGAIEVDGDNVRIGAAATLASLEAHEQLTFLKPALRLIASPTVRNMATVGGNLFAPCPYGDLAACLIALDAEVEVLSADGTRTVGAEAIVADGVSADELVTAVRFERPAANGWFFTKAMRRKLNSASIVTIVARLTMSDGVVSDARVALGGCAPTSRRSPAAEASLEGRPLDAATVDTAAQAALADTEFSTDEYASAWYRRRVFPVHFRRALLGETDPEGAA